MSQIYRKDFFSYLEIYSNGVGNHMIYLLIIRTLE